MNAPYSEETEQTQKLDDGTHIVTKSHARLYRDSSGRTRMESFGSINGVPSDEPTIIHIQDPVAGTTYFLRVQERTAQLMSPLQLPNKPRVLKKAVVPSEEMRPKSTSEEIGTQSFDGVLAEGVRLTTIFPPGSVGNDRPFQVVQETWYSKELGLTLFEKRSDPRSGESIMRVTSFDRSEPDLALFQVPPDYTLQDPNAK
jgi:hypothetical protein